MERNTFVGSARMAITGMEKFVANVRLTARTAKTSSSKTSTTALSAIPATSETPSSAPASPPSRAARSPSRSSFSSTRTTSWPLTLRRASTTVLNAVSSTLQRWTRMGDACLVTRSLRTV